MTSGVFVVAGVGVLSIRVITGDGRFRGIGHVARVLRCCWEPRSDPSRYEHAVRFSYESTLPTNFGHNRMGLDEDDTLDAQGSPKRIFLARYAAQKPGVSLPAPVCKTTYKIPNPHSSPTHFTLRTH